MLYRVVMVWGAVVALLAGGCAMADESSSPGVSVARVDHRGLGECVELRAGSARVVVVPSWAGRLSVVNFGGGNVLHRNAAVDGRVLPADQGWGPWDGNATDVVRGVGKESKNQFKGLWLHPWSVVETSANQVRLASADGLPAGVRAERSYCLSADGSRLKQTYRITAEEGGDRPWTVWERAVVPADRYVLAPAMPARGFGDGYKTRDGQAIEPRHARTVGEFVQLRAGRPKGRGLAAHLRQGWLAAVRGRDVLLVTWPLDPAGRYPHEGGAHAVFWVADEFIEIEPLSPSRPLARGQSLALEQVWHHLEVPESVDADDPRAVGRWIEGRYLQLAAEADGVSPSDPPLPRVAVADGQFLAGDADRPIEPQGFNYIRLRGNWHATFSPRRYQPHLAQAMFEDIARRGFNTVRVFIDPAGGEGIDGGADLSRPYLRNLRDFLRRARRQGVYVVPSLLGVPATEAYNRIVGQSRRRWSAGNRAFLDAGLVEAKATYVAEMVRRFQGAGGSLASTVLAWELGNETTFYAHHEPFSLREGTVTGPDGRSYDAADEKQLQQLADEAVIRWADACVEAAGTVDPEAMVSVNVFTFAAVGRPGPGRLHSAPSKDPRFPARPLALARSKLHYIDIHLYPFDQGTLERDLRSIEWPAFRDACAAAGKPIIMGEFGSFKNRQRTLAEAVELIDTHLARVGELGFDGFLYWTYDTDEQRHLWNARSGEGQLLDLLARWIDSAPAHVEAAARTGDRP